MREGGREGRREEGKEGGRDAGGCDLSEGNRGFTVHNDLFSIRFWTKFLFIWTTDSKFFAPAALLFEMYVPCKVNIV